MSKNNSIALLPLDNRPVSYLLPKQICDFSGIDLILPERKHLGNLNKGSDLKYLDSWCRGMRPHAQMTMIVSLDNFIYGGLIQSRKHDFTLEELKSRADSIKNLNTIEKYGFSSVMRIPNYNNSDEEKDYWKDYGEKIFKWSEITHKVGRGIKEGEISHEQLLESWYQSSKQIPVEVLSDYKGLRDKNLTVNLLWLESLHKNCFKYLIFSCDDSAQYGMNVIEAEYLEKEIKKHNFSNRAKVISGTDEIPLILITKAVLERSKIKPSISLYFNSTNGMNERARYESSSLYNSIMSQLNTLEVEIKDYKDSDILLCIHCADSIQGDHIFGNVPSETKQNVKKLLEVIEQTNKPFIILDLAYANGADSVLIEALIKSKINWSNCYGYAGWNTCSNSTGTALAIGINRWISEKENKFNKNLFKKCLLTRFVDDYAYQAKIRHSNITIEEINKKLSPFVRTFSEILGIDDINVKCSLPWDRSFEIEITV